MTQIKPVGELTFKFLAKMGCSPDQISSWSSATRLLQDLCWCGDDALDALEILHTQFGVDLTEFKFENYFPNEASRDAYYISSSELLRRIGLTRVAKYLYGENLTRIYKQYPEVTFEMIEEALKKRKWIKGVGVN